MWRSPNAPVRTSSFLRTLLIQPSSPSSPRPVGPFFFFFFSIVVLVSLRVLCCCCCCAVQVILYSFYKNFVLTFTLFYFCFYTGFSGQVRSFPLLFNRFSSSYAAARPIGIYLFGTCAFFFFAGAGVSTRILYIQQYGVPSILMRLGSSRRDAARYEKCASCWLAIFGAIHALRARLVLKKE